MLSPTSLDTRSSGFDLLLMAQTAPLEPCSGTNHTSLNFAITTSNRYNPLSKDLDVYIKEGAWPRINGLSAPSTITTSDANDASLVDENFLFQSPKGASQPK